MASTFKPIDLEQSLSEETHAAHCLLWFKDSSSSFGLMQLRSDGLLGFVGGFVDEEIDGIESIVQGLNRELKEEINCDEAAKEADYVFTDQMQAEGGKSLMLHFFIKRLTKEQFEGIESNSPKAVHYLTESLGIFRVPLKDERFLDNFLRASIFCGNSRDQLTRSIEILTQNKEL